MVQLYIATTFDELKKTEKPNKSKLLTNYEFIYFFSVGGQISSTETPNEPRHDQLEDHR